MKLVVLCVALCLFNVVLAAKRTDFVLVAEGDCNMKGTDCKAKGTSQTIKTVISNSDAVKTTVDKVPGSYAEFDFKITHFQGHNFISSGTVSFGTHLAREHTVDFIAMGPGFSTAGPSTTVQEISALYKITGGTGVFKDSFGSMSFTGEYDDTNEKFFIGAAALIYTPE
eukprot:TRINITY_DN5343_c0_g1_i1.p1 TRINITY_DN5343_c0_g1~~TRINITY_DN5343_c0_g1_i1.p1  ORF type:complete len:169 (-),score=32.08 TRINITY_DN5343_c0_g1_i1:56-562(-)